MRILSDPIAFILLGAAIGFISHWLTRPAWMGPGDEYLSVFAVILGGVTGAIAAGLRHGRSGSVLAWAVAIIGAIIAG